MGRRTKEWVEHVTRMDVERLLKISREKYFQDARKEDRST